MIKYKLIIDYNKNILTNSAVNEMKQYFSMSIPENLKVLPTPYWIQKIHRSPIGAKFIITRGQCVIKPLSKNNI